MIIRFNRPAAGIRAFLVAHLFILQFVHVGAAYASSIELAWDASSDANIAGYNVYRSSQSGNFTSTPLNGASLISTVSFTDSTVFSGTYYYVVTAVNSVGQESAASNEVQATASTLPLPAPTGLDSHCGSDAKTFTVSWNPVSGAESYYLRIDYLPNNVNGEWFITDGVDYNLDAYTGTTFTGNVITGQTYSWWVHAANATSGIGSSSSGSFTCANATDTTPPTVSISSPLQGAVISPSPNITVSAQASDDVGIVGVQFKLNGTNWGTEDATAPYSLSWDTKRASAGIYTIQAVARDAAGNRTTSVPVSVTISKGKGNNLQIVDSSGPPWIDADDATVRVGYATAAPELSAISNGFAIIRLRNGNTIVSETSLPATAPVREGRLYVRVDGPVNTAVAIANDESEDAVVSFYFTDAKGSDFGHGTFTLEAKQSLLSSVNEAPFNLAESLEGTLTFCSTLPVAVSGLSGLTNERGEFLMTALPITSSVTAPTATSAVLPHFADGAGWSTQIVLVNPTDKPLAGTLQFFGSVSTDGGALPLTMTVNGVTDSSFDYAVPPRTSVRFATSNLGTDITSGYVLATAQENNTVPQAISMFSFSNQGVTVSQTGVSAVPSETEFRTYVEKLETLHSGFAVANPSTSSIWTTFELLFIDGSSTNMSTSMEIPARGHTARFVDDLFPTIREGFRGMLRISAMQAVFVTSLRFENNGRGDLIVTGMPAINEASVAARGSKLVFPLVVTGGGFSTEFIGEQQ